ncbi:MAG: amidophosphoribosyltransferase [Deltaproteobacteria bacterium CG11_big_fil_rev_8_21_14_0_20_47_16]|nr:MAG: amidophosphoribosyltransferase [Deltaproteobacteria bacterium CG11_big_fil_rev_8_21_14_0_20_47_16]
MCGIVGVYNSEEAANLVYLGLYALQHRGQESAGIATGDGKQIRQFRGMGLVADIFSEDVMKKLPGHCAIGHTRYATSGETVLCNAQPFVMNYAKGWLAIAHNGNLTNATKLRKELEAGGSIFQSSMDSEVFMHLIANEPERSLKDRIISACQDVEGAYSLLFLGEDLMIAVRDPYGWRPLVIGKKGDTYVVASETCALDLFGATFERAVEPGEVIIWNKEGMKSYMLPTKPARRAQCVFEYIYFARPDSDVFGRNVYQMRVGYGKELAKKHPTKADIVIPVPDSGVPAAIGYAAEAGLPFQMGLIRNHYVGRTFIEPQQSIRNFGVKLKLNPVREILKDKRVVVVDDSIVRGTTCKKIVGMLRRAGAKEIHMRISAPPTKWPCYYGIDTPTREELIAASHSIEETCKFIGADSLEYLTEDELFWFDKKPGEWFCDACFTGNYPTPVDIK